jgi:m7GpppX diphosphatase
MIGVESNKNDNNDLIIFDNSDDKTSEWSNVKKLSNNKNKYSGYKSNNIKTNNYANNYTSNYTNKYTNKNIENKYKENRKNLIPKLLKESYDDYLEFISKGNFEIDKWIYDIIDGIAEKEKIIYQDEKIIILPTYIWNEEDTNKMHLLTIPTDKTLRTIRDLSGKNIELLEYMKKKTFESIKSKYNFDPEDIKAYFHYPPSTHHLHIHFVLVLNKYVNSSVECSYDLSTVIEILKAKPDFFQSIIMNKKNFL